jgi:hypothetical protein
MDELQKIAVEAMAKYPDDIDKAVAYASSRAKSKPWYEGLVNALCLKAIREMIADARHTSNVVMRNSAGRYGGQAKVVPGSAVLKVAASYYNYCIAGQSLGSTLGESLLEIAENEEAKANGHMFNTYLCRALRPMVPDGKVVRDCIPEVKLRKLFTRYESTGTRKPA